MKLSDRHRTSGAESRLVDILGLGCGL